MATADRDLSSDEEAVLLIIYSVAVRAGEGED